MFAAIAVAALLQTGCGCCDWFRRDTYYPCTPMTCNDCCTPCAPCNPCGAAGYAAPAACNVCAPAPGAMVPQTVMPQQMIPQTIPQTFAPGPN